MERLITAIGRRSALALTFLMLSGCDGNPTEKEPPPPESADRYFVFEPTAEVTPTSYYKGTHGEFVTYGRVRPNPATSTPEYEQTGVRSYLPQGSVTVTQEDGGYFVVFDTKSEPNALGYRVRESSASAWIEVYLIDEASSSGIVIADTVVPRIPPAAPNRLAANGPLRSVEAACLVAASTNWFLDALNYAQHAARAANKLTGNGVPAVGGMASDHEKAIRAAVGARIQDNCPREYGDRTADCPRCFDSLLNCIVDRLTGNPTRCCVLGDCRDNVVPPGNSVGDVHIRTPDGLAYDFQGAGEYLLMASSDGSVVVQSRQEPWHWWAQASVNTAVAMRVAGDRVGVYLERSPQLVINGTPTPFNGGRIDLPNGGAVVDAEPGYLILWPNGFRVGVRGESSFLDIGMSKPEGSTLSYSGLLGNMNGDPADDFFARGGQRLALPVKFEDLYRVFGASWQITQAESLFDYEAGESTGTFALPGFPGAPVTVDDLEPDIYQAARSACLAAGISDPIILNDCILDVGLTGRNEFIRSGQDAPVPARELDVDFPDGLVGSYYDGYFDDDLSFFDGRAPVLTRVDNPIDFQDDSASWDLGGVPELADLESFSVVWRGRLVVPQSGTYTLYLSSDDASYLFLGDAARSPSTSNATIDNGTAHPLREVSVELRLEAGDHPLMIVYGEEERNNIVQFSWSSTELGISKQVVTALERLVSR